MNSFQEVMLYELGGRRYCERCFHFIVEEKQAQRRFNVEISATPSRADRQWSRIMTVAAKLIFAVALFGSLVATIILVLPRGRRVLVSEYDATPAFRPSNPDKAAGSPMGSSRATPSAAGAAAEPGSSPKNLQPVDLAVVKGSTQTACPVCSHRFSLLQQLSAVTCPNCGRTLRLKEYELLPSIRFVGREARGAIFRMGDQERAIGVGEEVSPKTGICLERFLAEGVLLVKTERVSMTDYRISPPQKVVKTVRLEQTVPKCRDEETQDLTVIQGTPFIQCDGHGNRGVYHANVVDIRIASGEPGRMMTACPLIVCWRQFRVNVQAAPIIEFTVSPDRDDINCPLCGFVRHLTSVEAQTSFVCLNCKRAIRVKAMPLSDVKYLGIEGGAVRIEHKGKPCLVRPGKEVWPGARIWLAGCEADGTALLSRPQQVRFTDYRTQPPTERKVEIPICWRLKRP
jgi:DNA-directed RNA polymerase subunit RPC12/RpoP